MKILFVVENLYPNMDANSSIIYNIANALKEKCEIVFLGINRTSKKEEIFKTYHVDKYEKIVHRLKNKWHIYIYN